VRRGNESTFVIWSKETEFSGLAAESIDAISDKAAEFSVETGVLLTGKAGALGEIVFGLAEIPAARKTGLSIEKISEMGADSGISLKKRFVHSGFL